MKSKIKRSIIVHSASCVLFSLMLIASMATSYAQTYFLNGTATSSGADCYQLTTTQGNQNGTVWYSEQINLSEPFELNFSMNFGTIDATGADGMVFVLQNVGTNALGKPVARWDSVDSIPALELNLTPGKTDSLETS